MSVTVETTPPTIEADIITITKRILYFILLYLAFAVGLTERLTTVLSMLEVGSNYRIELSFYFASLGLVCFTS